MSQPNTQRHLAAWKSVCNETDLVSNSGVVVWLDGAQVALFYLPGAQDQTLYAIDNHDPESGANVIGRGLRAVSRGAGGGCADLQTALPFAGRPVPGGAEPALAGVAGAVEWRGGGAGSQLKHCGLKVGGAVRRFDLLPPTFELRCS